MKAPALYLDNAELYDRIYHWKDYAGEAERLVAFLEGMGIKPGSSVLEAACGTGTYLQFLRHTYRVSGFDLSPEMVEVARSKLPEVPLFTGDLCTFSVSEQVDAVVCLFSSIGYVFPQRRLSLAAERCFAAVRPGGVVIIEPWIIPEKLRPGTPSLQTYDGQDLKIARGTVSVQRDRLSVFDMNYLIIRRSVGVTHFVEHHELWSYTPGELVQTFEEAGFSCTWDPEGLTQRGLLLGRRPE